MSDSEGAGGPPRTVVGGAGWQLGRILGVPVIVQPVWFVVVVLIAVTSKPAIQERAPSLGDAASYALSLGFVVLLYGSVLVHEISHVAVAKALGMQVRRLVLQMFGGVTEVVEEQPGQAGREYLVAAVGPLTSLLLGGVGLAFVPAFDQDTLPRLLAEYVALTNLVVAGFNALPGLPLDGGRVLRALLWQLTHDKAKGTLAAGWVGRGLAVGLLGLAIAQPARFVSGTTAALYLAFVAAYMWMSAGVAISTAKVSVVLPRLDIRALTRRALPVAADLPVSEAVRRARDDGARALVVVDGFGKPTALVSEAGVSALPPQRQPWVTVGEVSRAVDDSLVVRTDMSGEALVQAVQKNPATEYLVVDEGGAVCGVLSRADLAGALQSAGLR